MAIAQVGRRLWVSRHIDSATEIMSTDGYLSSRESVRPVSVRRALLLANSQASRVSDQLPEAIAQLQRAGLELTVKSPHAPHEMKQLIVEHRDLVDLVIVGGGDGTLNAAVDALVETHLPLAILPLGTANDLARTIGLPTEISEACRVIIDGNVRRIDLGCVNGKHFFNAASIGLSVNVTRQLDKNAKKRWGVFAYLFTASKSLLQMRPFHAEINDGKMTARVKTVQITIGNGRFFGGGMTVAEDAAIDDQLLNFYSIEIRHAWELPLLFWSLRHGRLSRTAKVRTMKGQYFEVTTRRLHRVNTDGELTAHTPATFRLSPRALTIFAPKNPSM
jgi:diacylglycerol kinase (ATP)